MPLDISKKQKNLVVRGKQLQLEIVLINVFEDEESSSPGMRYYIGIYI